MFFLETNFIPISRKSTSRLCTHTLAIILCPETRSFKGSYLKNIMRLILLISVSKNECCQECANRKVEALCSIFSDSPIYQAYNSSKGCINIFSLTPDTSECQKQISGNKNFYPPPPSPQPTRKTTCELYSTLTGAIEPL